MSSDDDTPENRYPESVAAALAVMDANIRALNAGDERAFAATLHFPHYRLSGGTVKVWKTPDDYFADFRARAGGEWRRSAFEDIRVVGASADKVHLDVRVDRFRGDGSLLAQFRSLWVIGRIDGRWAAQFRSSFAEDPKTKPV